QVCRVGFRPIFIPRQRLKSQRLKFHYFLSHLHPLLPNTRLSPIDINRLIVDNSKTFQRTTLSKGRIMDVDSQPTMEETVLVGDDLMLGPPSPLIPPEIASHVLEGVNLCDGILRNLFLCLQVNDIEPFCQEEIALYRECAEKRDKELRKRLQDSEYRLGLSMPLDQAKERASQLESETTTLERRLILASGMEGAEGFRQRWSLHGRLTDTKKRMEALKEGLENRKKDDEPVAVSVKGSTGKRWLFW
ncbi:unnamed protein product, partial [Lactuca virosa]